MTRLVVLLVLALVALPRSVRAAESRAAAWAGVKEAEAQNLPKTALERLEPILRGALTDQAWAEAAKAILYRITLETQIQGSRPEERVTRHRAALREVPPPLQPVFHTLLGHAYWGYFQANRWRIQQRSATGTAAPAEADVDFLAWDLRRLFAEINREFLLALAGPGPLQRTPLRTFDGLLERGNRPEAYRPTLYDFLVHEALDFLASGEQAGARPEDAFVVPSDSPMLEVPSAFLEWRPSTTDTNAVAYQAIGLFQSLLRFHARDADPSAFLDADLARLRYGHNVAAGPDGDDRFLQALRGFVQRAGNHALAAEARHDWARLLWQRRQGPEAHAVASEALRQFPSSPGAIQCANLIAEIEAREARIETERVWNGPSAELTVTYRNVTNVWFRAIAVDWESFLDRRRPRPSALDGRQRLELLARQPALEWSHRLPPTPDYREHRETLPAPDRLAPGYYFVFASHRADFTGVDNVVSVAEVWVSDLALVMRPRAGVLEGFVLDANSGEPVPDATVEAWYLANNGARTGVPPTTTDALGFFRFTPRPTERGYLLRVRQGERRLAIDNDVWLAPRPGLARTPPDETLFFTDRSLYRPGQSVQYKGICVRHDQAQRSYRPLAGQTVTVVFRDPNGKEVARQSHRANDFGSFAGSFTAPRDRLAGRMIIAVEGTPAGATWINVEEYKRPKFQVQLESLETASRLGDRVRVGGRALAYTGTPVDHARVTWRVNRQVRFPPWWTWFRRGPAPGFGASQEIAHGSAVTDADGTFQVEFTAVPDPSVAAADEPVFHFEVHADVTDANGETRSGERRVALGYTAFQAELTARDWQVRGQPVELVLATKNHDDVPQSLAGTLRIHRLEEPPRVRRREVTSGFDPAESGAASDPNTWGLGPVVAEQSARTGAAGQVTNRFDLAPGLYRAIYEARDAAGRLVTARLPLQVLDPQSTRLELKIPQVIASPSWDVEPGRDFQALWGTGYDQGRAFIEVEHREALVARYWTQPGRTQQELRVAVTEAMRGGFTLHVTQVRENRGYLVSRRVNVPWSDRTLDLRWETFRSRLEPGTSETWTAIVRSGAATGSQPLPGPVEMVAALYDASLDQFLPHGWPNRFGFWPVEVTTARPQFANTAAGFDIFHGQWTLASKDVSIRYPGFPANLLPRQDGGFPLPMPLAAGGGVSRGEPRLAYALAPAAAGPMPMAMNAAKLSAGTGAAESLADAAVAHAAPGPSPRDNPPPMDPAHVSARKNLQETAFFLPQLVADTNGNVRLTFTMPEALTEWRFLGFAHDRELRSGSLSGRTVTAKDLMVQPNPPRFLREGDELEFTVKVANASTQPQSGRVRLELAFALDDQSADAALGNRRPELEFSLAPKESRAFSWRLRVPDGCGFLRFKAVAASNRLSDGEEGFLPVLSRRVHLTESLPLPIRGPGTARFKVTSLADAARSRTLRHAGLTVELVSQPAWYAVLALPYLVEYPHECSEQIFNRLYANALARHIAGSDPKIRRVFDQWRDTPALDSPLEKNADLKSVALEETPWLRAATSESQARRHVAELFEESRMTSGMNLATAQLAERQLPDGGWSWFPGGSRDEFITLYIAAGFGRLRHLGVAVDATPAHRALDGLDAALTARHQRLKDRSWLEKNNLDAHVALHLYGRTFFLGERPVPDPHRPAFDYFVGQALQFWTKLDRQSQAHVALALHRLGATAPPGAIDTARTIVRSFEQTSVVTPELGRFWRDTERNSSWSRAPIETQALMIEAFAEIANDAAAVDGCQVWLLKQKQTQSWPSTKATADAIYALLLRGTNLLASDALVEIKLGGRTFGPAAPAAPRTPGAPSPIRAVEPGTGYYQVHVAAAEITPKLADIVLQKADPGVAWGSVHWQYFEDLDRVKPYGDSPLHLGKSLFVRRQTKSGPTLDPVRDAVAVGDELLVRLELRVDRDLEYVHLKDQRGSGTEPVNVVSGYRFQDGLGYYETTRDTASHFFIGYLPKGTYVFEYPIRIQHRGEYTSGVAEVQCLYAPEFNSHSGSTTLQVRR